MGHQPTLLDHPPSKMKTLTLTQSLKRWQQRQRKLKSSWPQQLSRSCKRPRRRKPQVKRCLLAIVKNGKALLPQRWDRQERPRERKSEKELAVQRHDET